MSGTAIPGSLTDTPLAADGSPLRFTPSWWEQAKTDNQIPAGVLARLQQGAPVIGVANRIAGVDMCTALFAWNDANAKHKAVYLHLNTLTDNHRTHLQPACMEQIGSWWISPLLLPADALIGYRIVPSREPLPDDIGTTQRGWKIVHDLGVADPLNPISFRDGFAHKSSLFMGPTARMHPEWCTAVAQTSSLENIELGAQVFATTDISRRVSLMRYPHSRSTHLLVVLDAEHWRAHCLAQRLEPRARKWDLLLVDAGSLSVRAHELSDPQRSNDLLARCLQAAHAAGANAPSRQTVVVGQSFGGLAALEAALRRPDLVGGAIAQSASLWQGSGVRGSGEGTLLRWLKAQGIAQLGANAAKGEKQTPRLVIQTGAHELAIRQLGRQAAALLAPSGVLVEYREVRGGHDYAWWRSGLSWGLDALEAQEQSLAAS